MKKVENVSVSRNKSEGKKLIFAKAIKENKKIFDLSFVVNWNLWELLNFTLWLYTDLNCESKSILKKCIKNKWMHIALNLILLIVNTSLKLKLSN